MESFDYNAELAPDLVKLLSAKLSDARKENETLREELEQMRKCSKTRKHHVPDISVGSDEATRLRSERNALRAENERLKGELNGACTQLRACVEEMKAKELEGDTKPDRACISGKCPAQDIVAQLKADMDVLNDKLSTQQDHYEEQETELRQQIDKFKYKYKKYKAKTVEREDARGPQSPNNDFQEAFPDPRMQTCCYHKPWRLCDLRRRITSALNGSILYRGNTTILPYQDSYADALIVVPTSRCEFAKSTDDLGSWLMNTYDFMELGVSWELFYRTENGTCYAGTFLCSRRGEYSREEYRDLDVDIQETIIHATTHDPPFNLCTKSQQNMIRRRYREGQTTALFIHLTYQAFNAPFYEELQTLKAIDEQRRYSPEDSISLKRKTAERWGETTGAARRVRTRTR